MTRPRGNRSPLRVWLVELFAFGNLTFLALDVYLAHSINEFARPTEWIPVFFSLTVPFLLLPGIVRRRHREGFHLWAGLAVGATSVLVGIAGFLLHLESNVFHELTLKALVYAAPFAGPLSYTGVGLLLILNRLEAEDAPSWGAWVVFLAMCGFVGNLALSLCDHAQNGFFDAAEWIPVIAAAFGFSFLLVATCRQNSQQFLKICLSTMALQILVGGLGFGLHLAADLRGPAPEVVQNVIYGAPVFAPLLFANLALLAMIGLWDMMVRIRETEQGLPAKV